MAEPDREQRKRLMQVALNEAALRQVNERTYGPGKSGGDLPRFPIVCECGVASCETPLTVDASLYSSVRADPHRFLVRTGHEIPEAERVVARHGDVSVVEKRPGEPRLVTEATDPRSYPSN
jgi:hypothetical protein